MSVSNLTGITPIPERSDATPGLWNARFSQIDANFASAQSIFNSSLVTLAYPVSSIESTVVDVRYGYGHVKRYGALGNGVTNDAPAVQRAFDSARALGCDVVYDGNGAYPQDAPINCTFAGNSVVSTHRSLRVRSEANTGIGTATDVASAMVIPRHGGHTYDLSGMFDTIWEGININPDQGSGVLTGWFMSRNTLKSSAGRHTFTNCRAFGAFVNSVVYAYGSEEDEYNDCRFFNTSSSATAIIAITANNTSNLSSSFISIATGTQSNLIHHIKGGSFHANSTGGRCFYIEVANQVVIEDAWLAAFGGVGATDGGPLIFVDTTNGASSYLAFERLYGEAAAPGLPSYGIQFSGATAACVMVSIRDFRAPTRSGMLNTDSNITLDRLLIEQISEAASLGISVGNLLDPNIRAQSMNAEVKGRMNRGFIIGEKSRWSIAPAGGKPNTAFFDAESGTMDFPGILVASGSKTTPSLGFSSETSLGFYRSGVSTIAPSYGTLNLATNAVRFSMRTLPASSVTASAALTNIAVDEVVFTIGGASGASFGLMSGGTFYGFNSAFSAKAT